MERSRIHILCLKSEICSLIKKTLTASGYEVSCSKGEEITESAIEDFSEEIDCLIMDTDINSDIREKAREKFSNSAIICLPSLESDINFSAHGTNKISEPLKLSELSEAVNFVLKQKKN